ncbi:Tetratricopeptide repeat protein 27, partial [Pseudolycoriella hygida]
RKSAPTFFYDLQRLIELTQRSVKPSDHNLQLIWKCDWKHFLTLPLAKKLILNIANDEFVDVVLMNSIELFSIAISSLQLFVQQNFTGPHDDFIDFILDDIDSSNDLRSELQVNGINLNVNVENPALLLLSIRIMKSLVRASPTSYVLRWWYLRVLYIYGEVLDELSESLYSEFRLYSEELLKRSDNFASTELKALLVLEITQQFLSYKGVYKAEEHLKIVQNLLNTKLEVKGEIGGRIKFQQKALPQLSLKVEGNFQNIPPNDVTHSTTTLPKLLRHDDDVRQDRVQFQSEEANTVAEIPSLIQLLVLAKVITTLLMNIHLEDSHKRTVDRSLRQCEDLSNMIKSNNVPLFHRLSLVYASFTRPRWFVQIQLGDLMLSLGVVKSALERYLKIQKWEDAIVCYTILDPRHKAAEIIRQEIEKKPTVELYCLLGDAADDPMYYELAWKMSNENSARVQKDWGKYDRLYHDVTRIECTNATRR